MSPTLLGTKLDLFDFCILVQLILLFVFINFLVILFSNNTEILCLKWLHTGHTTVYGMCKQRIVLLENVTSNYTLAVRA